MDTALFDYPLPPELIAQRPLAERSAARLLVHERAAGRTRHATFRDLADLVPSGDLLVLNRARVLPARLPLPSPGGGRDGEILYLGPAAGRSEAFLALVRPGKRFRPGRRLPLPHGLAVEVLAVHDDGRREMRFAGIAEPREVFRRHGVMPLPPYVTGRESTADEYQTVFAQEEGAVASPTAGLHFDPPLLAALRARGVEVATVLLHVGLGTFKPIKSAAIEDHVMHAEDYVVPADTAAAFAAARARGAKVWACGTTVVRVLETAVRDGGTALRGGEGTTRAYLRPGHAFVAVDHLITNFHLPRTTLLVLVSAFAGRETTLALYAEAVRERYRFFSFGDAMVLI